MTDTKTALKVSKLSKCFTGRAGKVDAVKDVSFDLKRGDFVALHGPSGCGKSTLLLMAGTLLSPDEGSVEIGGKSPYELPIKQRAGFRAEHVGFVFQQFHLIPYLNVLENVLVGELAGGEDSLKEKAESLLEGFGLSHRLGHVPNALSIGEQQRVALARALVRSPDLLLADEPTGNLDKENSETILGHLNEFAGKGGAVLMVTHDDQAREAASRSWEMKEGTLLDE